MVQRSLKILGVNHFNLNNLKNVRLTLGNQRPDIGRQLKNVKQNAGDLKYNYLLISYLI